MQPKQRLYQLAGLFTAFNSSSIPRLGSNNFLSQFLPTTRSMSVQVGQTTIDRPFLSGIRDIWFKGHDEKALVASDAQIKKWFMGKSEEFDSTCR